MFRRLYLSAFSFFCLSMFHILFFLPSSAFEEPTESIFPDLSFLVNEGKFPDYNARWFRKLDTIGFDIDFVPNAFTRDEEVLIKANARKRLESSGLKIVDRFEASSKKYPFFLIKVYALSGSAKKMTFISADLIREVSLCDVDTERGFTSVWHKYYFCKSEVVANTVLKEVIEEFLDLNTRSERVGK